MLYGYPVAATSDNWLHNCLCEVLKTIHTKLQAAQNPPTWPTLIPSQYREQLRRRTGLKERLAAYQDAAKALTAEERERVFQALNDQNKIAGLLSCVCECEAIEDLPQSIQKPVRELFSFAFELLTDFGTRDTQYKTIYDFATHRVCPFCGCEYFDAPTAPREALDHYLPEFKYPFAAANLRNLVPMGNKCNSRYKLAKDILRRSDGSRRKAYDPYIHQELRVSLDQSQPFAGKDGRLPKWKIEFEPDSEEAITWDDVFSIRERYERDILNESFNRWLGNFGSWCRSSKMTTLSNEELTNAIERYAEYSESIGISDRAFLRAAVFRMLLKHCQNGDQRLIDLLRTLL